MENYCAFSKNHKCLNWTDYELTRYELEEAGSLCQANWIEITGRNPHEEPSNQPLKLAPQVCPS